MSKAEAAVRESMHERGEATRPQLAAATGLSLVTVGKVVERLCRRGELKKAGEVPSGGGRPVQLYRYNADYARHVLVQMERAGTLLHCTVALLDLQGRQTHSRTADFAYLEKESLDGLLSDMLRGRRLSSIMLLTPPDILPPGLEGHLENVYHCKVRRPTLSTLLAEASPEGTATLCLAEARPPSCTIRRNGRLQECGPLHLLPMPAEWEKLDYSERSLVEEMTARLLHIITCTLRPAQIILYTPLLSSRLTERIRYNAATKLKGALPELKFQPLTPQVLSHATHRAICSLLHP